MEWVNEHTPECPVTAARMKLADDLEARPEDTYLLGAVPEYDHGGDQEVELCTCSRRWSFVTKCRDCGNEVELHESGLCDSCEMQRSYDRASIPDRGGMALMVCIDGAEAATVPLIDGNDSFNAAAERGALDRAYEFKSANPDEVVSIVLAGSWGDDEPVALSDEQFIAENLELLADIDEGQHTDSERLRQLAGKLRDGHLVTAERVSA